jgi:long-chain acyl-CoA synthetase
MNMGNSGRVQSVAELPALAAHRFGDHEALITESGTLTFAQIERKIEMCANGLHRLGVRAGERVILHLPNGWEWIVGYYAILRLGAIVVPANILLVPAEIAYIIRDCGARGLIAPSERMTEIGAAADAGRLQHLVCIGPDQSPGATRFDELFDDDAPSGIKHPAVTASDLCTVAYTSGTTGRPKGALLTHRAVLMNTSMTALMHARSANDIVVTALPCAHVYGNVVMNGAFLAGYQLVLFSRFHAETVLEAIQRHRATLFEGVPTMYYYLLGCESLGRHDLSSLTRCTVGGQTMTVPQILEAQQRLGCPLHELWGMTEIAGLGATHPAYVPPRVGSIGQPLPFNEFRIASLHESDTGAPDGEIGELLVRGPTVMQGYYQQDTATQEVLQPDGWLHTGDLARRDPEGYYFIVDRKKEMIITAGYNIYPSEVERVIASYPGVQMVAVAGVPDGVKGELAHAFVVMRPQAPPCEEELREYCRKNLAAYKVPKAFCFVSDLPKTSSGKITRVALKGHAQSAD